MSQPLRLFVLAGEASGDRIGADLVQRLKTRGAVAVTGVGGPELIAEGLQSLFAIDELAVMGWSDVVVRLPLLLWRVRQVAHAIVRQRPDAAVLIDSQVFSRLVAERVRRTAPEIPLILYVAPTVWAYRPERAARLAPLFDEVLAVLPFEPAAMARLGGPPTTYVGHPALARFHWRTAPPARGPLLLLPGSRAGELRRHLSMVRAVAEALHTHPAVTRLILPTLTSLAEGLRAEVADWSAPVEIVTGAARATAFAEAVAAFAVSGTVTLELALSGVPMAVVYVGDPHQQRLYERINRPLIALPNILAGRAVVPELPLPQPDPRAAVATVSALLDDPAAPARQARAFAEIRALLESGAPEAPRHDPAERVLAVAAQRASIAT
jgi:lipid-A-disaccharide synthase